MLALYACALKMKQLSADFHTKFEGIYIHFRLILKELWRFIMNMPNFMGNYEYVGQVNANLTHFSYLKILCSH